MKSHEEYVLSLLGACESCAECTLEGFICKLEENYIYLLSASGHVASPLWTKEFIILLRIVIPLDCPQFPLILKQKSLIN